MQKLSLGWDGEGGVPATSNAVDRACQFIDQLTDHFDTIKQPFATATPDGGVLIQWKIAKDNSLEVEFSPTEKGIPAKYSIFDSKTLDSLEGTIRDPENYHRWPYALKLLFLSF